jgi:putative FmdB family regulatory protein
MPTYEYVCRDCGHQFEVFQSFTEEGLTICERCGGSLRKVFYPAGVVFKGSGFYKTDSRAASANGSSKKEKKEPAPTTSSSDSSQSSKKKSDGKEKTA